MRTPATPEPPPVNLVAYAIGKAAAEGWSVFAQAADGSRLQLRRGHPARTLVLCLSEQARLADDRSEP